MEDQETNQAIPGREKDLLLVTDRRLELSKEDRYAYYAFCE